MPNKIDVGTEFRSSTKSHEKGRDNYFFLLKLSLTLNMFWFL